MKEYDDLCISLAHLVRFWRVDKRSFYKLRRELMEHSDENLRILGQNALSIRRFLKPGRWYCGVSR